MGGMTRLLLLLWAGVTVGSVVDLQKRIYGGHDCLNTERLYHVQLRVSAPRDEFVCGGSLISDQWILTAAHCWDLYLYAVVGAHPDPEEGKPMEVKAHFDGVGSDIMLLEITNPQPNIFHHNYIKLPDCTSDVKVGTNVQIAGHIETTVEKNKIKVSHYSEKLQCADTDVVDCTKIRDCMENNHPKIWEERKNNEWLCYKRDKVDTSGGDSGGGVVSKGTIYGVHSFGDAKACVYESVAMNVCGSIKWIKSLIDKPGDVSG